MAVSFQVGSAIMAPAPAAAQAILLPPDTSGTPQQRQVQPSQRSNLDYDSLILPPMADLLPVPFVSAEEGITIREINFTGDEGIIGQYDLGAVVADILGNALDFSGLEALTNRITQFLQMKEGLFLARALLPQQELSDGRLQIFILSGRLDDPGFTIIINPENPPLVDTPAIADIAGSHFPAHAMISEQDVERAVLLINDRAGVSATATLSPGEEQGTTKINIQAQPQSRISGNVGLNNYGSRDTGTLQSSGTLNVNSLLGKGDQLTFTLGGGKGIRSVAAGWRVPIGGDGVNLNINGSHLNYVYQSGVGKALGYEGTASRGGIGLSYPLIRARRANLFANSQIVYNRLYDDSDLGGIRYRKIGAAIIGLDGNLYHHQGNSSISLQFMHGRVDLSGNRGDQQADAAGYRTHGTFQKANINLRRNQQLFEDFSLFAKLSGQYALDNLDSSEQFILGGPAGIRAYAGTEGSGDIGYVGTLELRYDVPELIEHVGRPQIALFADTGEIRQHRNRNNQTINSATGKNRYRLHDVGIGITLNHESGFNLGVTYARQVGNNSGRNVDGTNSDNKKDNDRFWIYSNFEF